MNKKRSRPLGNPEVAQYLREKEIEALMMPGPVMRGLGAENVHGVIQIQRRRSERSRDWRSQVEE